MTGEIAPVAVLGGGLAGAAACLRLTALDLAPLWIAPSAEVGDKPGEHLAPTARPLLARLGAAELLDRPAHRPANAMLSAWGSDRLAEQNAIVHLEGPATVVDRPLFERDLADRALAGDVRRVESRVTGIERRDGVWHLAAGSGAGEGAAFRAGFLIDATGRAAVLARDRAQRFRADRLAALYGFLERDPAATVEPTGTTLIEASEDGWWYAALLADGRLALSFYSDADLLPAEVTRRTDAFAALLRQTRFVGRWVREAAFRLERPPHVASAATTWIAPAAGEGWAAAGDAAAAFDPLSSHGMTTALWTGISAAEAAADALAGRAQALGRYAMAVAVGVQEFLQSRAAIYGQEARFADRPFWQRRQARAEQLAPQKISLSPAATA